ncbi:histidine kinase [Streptomyces varsoviensis]|uniref:histidine kinase n=1 Tax=Streptomyces varsoviensis TaxID=67373 RepID=UPI0033DF1AE2
MGQLVEQVNRRRHEVSSALAQSSPRERLADLVLWVCLCVPVAYDLIRLPAPALAVYAGMPALALAMLLSRALPLLSLYITVALSLGVTLNLFNSSFCVAMLVMGYLVGRRTRQERPALVGFAVIAAAGLVAVAASGENLWTWFTMAVTLGLNVLLPWMAGRYRRQYADLTRAGWELAERMEREQQIIADRTRLRERSRIAGDMHDSLGHELSLLALRAGALEMAPDLDERHRKAAGELRAAAASVTESLHDVIGVLREDAETAPKAPARESVTDLVERAVASGLAVDLAEEGEPVRLAFMVDRALYRVVQESLTNAAKHAPGAAVSVRIAHLADATEVRVVNGPPPARPDAPSARHTGLPSGKNGLVGLRERVRLAGGTLRTGPYEGGFEVTARLPHAAGAARPAGEESAREDASESAFQRRHAQRRARRGLKQVILVPLAVAAVLAALMGGFSYIQTEQSVLDSGDYERLRVGQRRSDAEDLLPSLQTDVPPRRDVKPMPHDSTCRYYRMSREPDPTHAYRVCFAHGRLAAKDVVPLPGD